MKIVVATEGGLEGNAATHFAHCSHFVVFEAEGGKVKKTKMVENPYSGKHSPGIIPQFVGSLGADVLVTDGIGPKAIAAFEKMDIKVVYGVRGKARALVGQYLKGKIKPDQNPCSH